MTPRPSRAHSAAHARFAKAAGMDVEGFNPAVSERQRRYMGADLARARAGQKTKTGMSESQLADFARKKKRS